MLIWGLQVTCGIHVSEIIWGLKFQDPKCAICVQWSKIWSRQDYLGSAVFANGC